MKALRPQLGGRFGTGFAAACCLGPTAGLSALSAIGADEVVVRSGPTPHA